jgi:glycosyltransferase involved in cell wall biosynthesis
MIALDATYSVGRNLSGVGAYSREILFGLARAHPEEQFLFCYRPHHFLRSFEDRLPRNASRRILRGPSAAPLFHALNQRVDHRARRTVATFHDLFVMTGEYSTPEFRARFTQQARQAAERSDLLIAVSEFTAGQIEALLGVERSRIRVIPHGVRLPSPPAHPFGRAGFSLQPGLQPRSGRRLKPPLQAKACSTGSPAAQGRENLVLTVGAVQKRKNIARLVRAFERMPPGWKLAIAGSGEGFGAAEELRAVEASPRRGDIDILGYVPAAHLEALYDHARIFAFPSLDEGFGMPILEAMAHGVAVVTSRRSACPETAGDAALLVDPENVEEIAAALLRLAADSDLGEELARRGRERALQFPWSSAVERTWAVYHEIL